MFFINVALGVEISFFTNGIYLPSAIVERRAALLDEIFY